MLVLTRKPGEAIDIGGGITITVVRIHGNKVQLGINAPPDVRVLRSELSTEDAAQIDSLRDRLLTIS